MTLGQPPGAGEKLQDLITRLGTLKATEFKPRDLGALNKATEQVLLEFAALQMENSTLQCELTNLYEQQYRGELASGVNYSKEDYNLKKPESVHKILHFKGGTA